MGQLTEDDKRTGKHMLTELGFTVRRAGDQLHGAAEITPPMHVPGTGRLRTSVLAVWSDMLGGLLSLPAMAPRVTVTLDLDVHLHRPSPGSGMVRAVGYPVKAGRSVFVAGIDFFDDADEPFGFSTATFMVPPGAEAFSLPERTSVGRPRNTVRLSVPLAERAGCARTEAGVASMPVSPDGLNAIGTMHGGLVALVAEEAALSLAPGETLSSIDVRYLRPVRTGPGVARARAQGGLSRVEVHDTGDGKLAALVTTRTFGG
jgi:acyl-coenzyme A thioesterase PaaI-like protein